MKLKFKKVLIILAINFAYLGGRTQSEVQVLPISIGQVCPDFEFNNLVRFPKSSIHLSDLRGKLVILDFWATWCGACMQAFPKLDQLQEKYPSQLFVLPVSYEKREVIEQFLQKSNSFERAHLPSIAGDSVLRQYFKFDLIPHDIWINGEGKVIAITGFEEVNEPNIRTAISTGTIYLPQKQDIFGQDIDKPLLLGGLGKDYKLEEGNLKCISVLTGNINGLGSGNATRVMKEKAGVKLLAFNTSLDNLFVMALRATYLSNNAFRDTNDYTRMRSRLIIEAKDSSYFIHCIPGSKKVYTPPAEKMFCYEIIRPLSDSLNISAVALTELNNYFGNLLGIEAIKEKRRVKCWVLVRLTERSIPYTKGGPTELSIDPENKLILLHNYSIDDFLRSLMDAEMFNYTIPVINETGISQPLDLIINADPADPVSVGKALGKYGLNLVLAERVLDMNVIREKKSTIVN